MPTVTSEHRLVEYRVTEQVQVDSTEDGQREYQIPSAPQPGFGLRWIALQVNAFHVTNGVEIVEPSRISVMLHTNDEEKVVVVEPKWIRGRYEFESPLYNLRIEDPSGGYHLYVLPPNPHAILQIVLHGYLDREEPDRSGVIFERGKEQFVRVYEAGVGDSVWSIPFSYDIETRPEA